jgi:endonuclease/exonuclease/phosphatase family metal-dependent hydrolase
MWAKTLLAALCVLMIAGALHFTPVRERGLLATRQSRDGPRLRLMTWNIGYAELETDTRAHTKDLKAVAETILSHDPDAVALQELTGAAQLKILLGYLNGRYRGAVADQGQKDRVEAVLVKDHEASFEDARAGEQYALGATFHLERESAQQIVLVSAHADAFNAALRRAFTGAVVDWARARPTQAIVFVAGDFNFEVAAADDSHLYTDNLKHDSEAYSYLLAHFRDLGRDAGDTAINDRRIDYIFGPPESALLRRAEVLRGAAVGRMDHWPLLVEVEL